ncbi:hypothetical protein ACHAXR_011746 [Thalassiosira sp. AJA248-18]
MSEEESATAEEETETPAAEEEEPKLDPEVVALKESITSLESSLKAKKSQLSSLKEAADKYTKSGYARQVAQMENNKRLRRGNMEDDKGAARATVLQTFVPVLTELEVVGKTYEGNAFAKTLDAGLRSELATSLNDLGVEEYVVEAGQRMDVGRVVVVEEEYSEEFGKGVVVRALRKGLEISGNVVRPAEVVGSLGSESAQEEEAATDGGEDGEAE